MNLAADMFAQLASDGLPAAIFTARVTIPVANFARLGLGEHEGPSDLPACFRWCFDRLGVGGARWSVRLPADADAILYFAEVEDAQAFLACWADTGSAVQPGKAPRARRSPAPRQMLLAA